MKLLIVGSRSITDFDLEGHIPPEADHIISGGANGVDTLAEIYADKYNIPKTIIRPDYARFGRGAPLKRNETMVDMCDELLVIWDGASKGTKYTADYAEKHGKKVTIIQKTAE